MKIDLTVDQVDLISMHFGGFDQHVSYYGEALVFTDEALHGQVSALVAEPDWEAPLMVERFAKLKDRLKAAIDGDAELERLKYITGGAGQAMTYARKTEEARALLAAVAAEAAIDPDDYPLLSASLGIDGPDLATIASVILGMDAAWAQIGAAIEAVRLGSKKAIDEAGDEAAARAAAEAVVWP